MAISLKPFVVWLLWGANGLPEEGEPRNEGLYPKNMNISLT